MIMHSTQWILLIALLPIGLLEGSRVCYHCTEWEWGQFCNISASSISCSAEESTCFSQVRYDSNSLRITKGCITKADCQIFLADNAADCSRGIITSGICSYCCDNPDHCNYDHYAYSNTTPAPITTTSVSTSLPWKPILPVTISQSNTLPSHCNSTAAEDMLNDCMAMYRGQIAWTLQNSVERFGEFCRHVPDVLHCVATSLEDCMCLDDAATPVTVLTPALKLLTAQCPSQCNQTAGLQCIQHSQSRILGIVISSPEFSCGVLYKEVTSGFQCVHFSVSSCSHSTFISYNTTQTYSYTAIERLCPSPTDPLQPTITLSGPTIQVPTKFPPEGSTATPIVSSTRTTPVIVTEDPNCNIEAVNDCLALLGHAVVEARVENLSFDHICLELVPATSLCLSKHAESCSSELNKRFQFARDYIEGLMGAECLITTPAPVCDPTKARLCIVRQWELIEGDYSIQEACDAVKNTTRCVRHNSQDCTPEEKSSLNTTLYNVLELLGDKCVEDVAQCNNETIIQLEEGGESHDIEFKFQKLPLPPCGDDEPDCQVILKLEAEFLDDNPRCLNGQQIPQFVVGRPFGGGSVCSEVITSENWRGVRRFKIAAKTDLKLDGDQEQKLKVVVKKVVGGKVVESKVLCIYTVRVIDKDVKGGKACTIWNDPHVRTFSKKRYEMHTQGWFQMYRHKTHPIEVQVGYQKCHSRATCICAVAVRAGDTVYLVDRCARKGCRRCKNYLTLGMLFYNKEITPGFRIFSSQAGTRVDIQLPHGAVVTMKAGRIFFNVIIKPSPADFLATQGLCGDYGDSYPWIFPNGTQYLAKSHFHLKDFFSAWRVDDDNLLINGVPLNPFRLGSNLCDCLQDEKMCHDGSTNACGTCTNQCEEITKTYPSTDLHKEIQQEQHKNNISDYDFDYKFVANQSVTHPNWTEVSANRHCLRSLVDKSPVVKQCLKVPGFEIDSQLEWCTRDVMITGDVNWADIHLEALKISCEQSINSNVDFYSSDEGANLTKGIYNLICANECSKNGECQQGKCVCDAGFNGQDCSVQTKQKPELYPLPNGGVCDMASKSCQNSVVFGDKFAGDEFCHVSGMEVSTQTTETSQTTKAATVVSKATLLSNQQLYCAIKVSKHSVQAHSVRLSYSETSDQSISLVYVVFNSLCHDCKVLNNSIIECDQQNTGCVVDGVCYEENAIKDDDDCQKCSHTDSSDSWTRVKALRCHLRLVYIIVGVIAALIVIACIIVCVCYRRQKKEERPLTREYSSAPRSLSVVYVSNCQEPNSPVLIGGGFKDGSCSTNGLSDSVF